jgi:hypothetical protein
LAASSFADGIYSARAAFHMPGGPEYQARIVDRGQHAGILQIKGDKFDIQSSNSAN